MANSAPANVVRRAAIDDARELARLRWDFTVELDHADEDLESFTRRFEPELAAFLASGRWMIWVTEIGARLVGTVFVERVDKVPRPYRRPSSWGYVTNVYVIPELRSCGIGRQMLDAAISAARAEGWQLLLLWPSEESGEFYARAGFRPSGEVLELDLLAEG